MTSLIPKKYYFYALPRELRRCKVICHVVVLWVFTLFTVALRTVLVFRLICRLCKERISVNMIETCSKRCMLFGTVCLGVLTIVVLILESHLADSLSGSHKMKNKTFPTENNSTCWQHQPFTIISECHPCSDFEIRSKSIGVCIHTSFKEILKCENGETVTRSCDRVAYLEERAYWKFTIWSFVIGAASSMAVMLRLRVLNYRAKRRARQVLSNGAIN